MQKLNKDQLNVLADKIIDRIIRFPRLRSGQCVSDILVNEHPQIALEAFKQNLDPYYDDRKIQLLIASITDEQTYAELYSKFLYS